MNVLLFILLPHFNRQMKNKGENESTKTNTREMIPATVNMVEVNVSWAVNKSLNHYRRREDHRDSLSRTGGKLFNLALLRAKMRVYYCLISWMFSQ